MIFTIGDFMKTKLKNIKYTLKHWVAYQQTAIKLKVWHPRHLLHDLDKIYLYLKYDKKEVQRRHRKSRRHHVTCYKGVNYLDAVIDWECARFTKPDKPLNAQQTLEKYYSEHSDKVIPILKQLNLFNHEKN